MKQTSPHILVVDEEPNMCWTLLAALIRQRSPHTTIVLPSGYYYPEGRAINEGLEKDLFIGFISKPFDLEEIYLMARRAVERAKKGGNANGPYSAGG